MHARSSFTAIAVVAVLSASALSSCGSAPRSALQGPPVSVARTSDTSTTATTTAATATVDTATVDTATVETSTTDAPTGDDTGDGWIGGEPAWTAEHEAERDGDDEHEGDEYASAEATTAETTSAGTAATTSAMADSSPLPAMSDVAPTDGAAAVPPGTADANAGLRAGNVDDNADFPAFLEYLGRIQGLGVTTRPFDPTGRIVVSVTGGSGLPVDGVEVTVSADDAPVATIRTTADGTARFLPALYGSTAQSFTFSAGAATATSAPGGVVALSVDAPGGAESPVAVDVLFLLDATGSMGDEIERLKVTIDSVAERISALGSAPDVHFAMTLYRDVDDSFVTTTFDFTGDVAAFRAAIDDVVAEGGGDYPEAMDEGLAEAMSVPSWRDPASTVQLVFLVADAPPQVGRGVQTPYPASVIDAISRGVKIVPIASSESDDQAEAVFRQIAQATGGRFVFLSYGAEGAATGDSTDIASTDYEELSLDDLIVRLVSEELAALTGVAPVEAPPIDVTTPPTNPPGQ